MNELEHINQRLDRLERRLDSLVDGRHHHCGCAAVGEVLTRLEGLHAQGEKIMAAIDDANAALKKIDDATTAQGVALAAEAASLQTLSDEMDAFIAAAGATVPAQVLADLQARADKVAAISDSIQKQADFSAAIAAKGVTNPVPVPVPPVTP